ncbi:hypothetical protein B0H10DRAFT_1940270 [Mycena sp. CBHHK59/15]|nr:hypothetical protein B0H10DRAFT_1940270 [Mycena sp. CBHHK59/15]
MSEKKGVFTGPYPIPLPVTDNFVAEIFNNRRRRQVGVFLLTLLSFLVFHFFVAGPPNTGFHELSTQAESKRHKFLFGEKAEELFMTVPSAESAIAASRLFATKPHLAGSDGDLQTAKDFLALLQTEFGIPPPSSEPIFEAGSPESQDATLSISKARMPKAWIDVYYPVMNTPLDRSLQALDEDGKVIWEAALEEVADDTDPEAGKYFDAVPTFHGLSPSGDVQGKDYDDLVAKGVNLTGAIIICRYGGIFRGLKVKGAQDLGAVGVLIYSDVRDDGTVTEANGYLPYPNGPARHPNSVQRGSVQFLSVYPGDPTTPGYPSYENSTRTEGENIPKIPSLPISSANGDALMKLFSGAGEGKQVRLVNNVSTGVTPIWNTMGIIPGYITDEVVVMGNHRDAWVMGATDPSSGTSSVNEVVRGLGALMKNGWKPLRTILICSWDAEEEWVEDFPEFIDKHVVTYLNLGNRISLVFQDSSVSGSRFGANGSPSLSHFIRETAQEIPHPTSPGRDLWSARQDMGIYGGEIMDAESAAVRQSANAMADSVGVGPLGSGSDYTAFLQMIGVASSDAGFGGTEHDAVYHYHSVFDSEAWQELYCDPGFHRHVGLFDLVHCAVAYVASGLQVAVAKHLGLQILRLSSAVVLPLNTTHYTYELGNYLDGVEKIASAQSISVDLAPLRKSIIALQAASHSLDFEKASAEKDLRKMIRKWHKRQSKLKKKLRKVYCRLKKIFGRKCHKTLQAENSCSLSGKASEAAPRYRVGRLPGWLDEQQGVPSEVLYGLAMHAGFHGPNVFDGFVQTSELPLQKFKKVVRRLRAVNKKLVGFEKGFISKDGIPERPWFRHLVVAPGKWLGYGATTLPALTEALTFDKNVTLAQYEVGRLTELIDNLADNIRVHA